MARNPHLNKPNGGALKPSATMGRAEKFMMDRLKPFAQFLTRLEDDTVEDVLEDAPEDVTEEDLQRAYLVELRVGEKTWRDSHAGYPFARLYYATRDLHLYRVQTTTGIIRDTDNGGYRVTDDADDEYRSSILTTGPGRDAPITWRDLSPSEIQDQYRRVLRDEHGLDINEEDDS